MRHERIIGMVLVGLTLAWRMPAAGAEALTLEALPVSAGAVELRWNQAVDSMIERRAASSSRFAVPGAMRGRWAMFRCWDILIGAWRKTRNIPTALRFLPGGTTISGPSRSGPPPITSVLS